MSQNRLGAFAVLVGGAMGALTRAAIGEALPHDRNAWPWPTFTANIAGTLLLAWVAIVLTGSPAHAPYWRLLVGTGFCGALTTFSTLQVETIHLMRSGEPALAAAYAVTSVVAGMAAAVVVTHGARRRRGG